MSNRPETITVTKTITITASGKQDWTDYSRTVEPQIEQAVRQLRAQLQNVYFGRD